MRNRCPVGGSRHTQVKAGWVGRGVWGRPPSPGAYPEPCRCISLHPRCRAVHAQVCV